MFLFFKYSLACVCVVKLCLGFVFGFFFVCVFFLNEHLLFSLGPAFLNPTGQGNLASSTTSAESQMEPVFCQLLIDWLTSHYSPPTVLLALRGSGVCQSPPTSVLALRGSWVWREGVRVSLFCAHGLWEFQKQGYFIKRL